MVSDWWHSLFSVEMTDRCSLTSSILGSVIKWTICHNLKIMRWLTIDELTDYPYLGQWDWVSVLTPNFHQMTSHPRSLHHK
jgi:hypothetical protein